MAHDPHHVAAIILGKMRDGKGDDGAGEEGDEQQEMVDEMLGALHLDHLSDDDKQQFEDALQAYVHHCIESLESEDTLEGGPGGKYDQGAGGSYDEK